MNFAAKGNGYGHGYFAGFIQNFLRGGTDRQYVGSRKGTLYFAAGGEHVGAAVGGPDGQPAFGADDKRGADNAGGRRAVRIFGTGAGAH